MTRPFALAMLLFAVLYLRPAAAPAQIYFPRPPFAYPYPPASPDPGSSPVELGAYVSIGGAGLEAPTAGGVVIGSAGLYGQWNRIGLCPGLDLRIQGNTDSLHGMLVGPRLAYQPSESSHFRFFHPYVEGLFGPNEFPSPPTNLNAYPPSHRGVTSAVVIGIDGDISPHLRFRLVEFTKEGFSGLSGTNPYTITTGIVLHLP